VCVGDVCVMFVSEERNAGRLVSSQLGSLPIPATDHEPRDNCLVRMCRVLI
jgi:hypothetical protein